MVVKVSVREIIVVNTTQNPNPNPPNQLKTAAARNNRKRITRPSHHSPNILPPALSGCPLYVHIKSVSTSPTHLSVNDLPAVTTIRVLTGSTISTR